MFGEVPVLPVVVPGAAALCGALLWDLRRRDRLSAPRAAIVLVLCVYAAGVVANTVFPIFLDPPVSNAPWRSSLHVVPFASYEVADAVTNIVVFVPLGILLPLQVRKPSWWLVVMGLAAFSLAIEISQYATAHLLHGGHIADVNDFIFNVLGGLLGFALLAAVSRVPGSAGLVDRFRWH